MDTKVVVPGTVSNGVVIPEDPGKLIDGSRVMILANGDDDDLAQLMAEMAAWDRLSDEAFEHILKLERESKP